MPSMAPVTSKMIATRRAIGQPRPAVWARFWKNTCWFFLVSGIDALVPSKDSNGATHNESAGVGVSHQGTGRSVSQSLEDTHGQVFVGHAVENAFGRARRFAAGDEGGDQAGHGGPARAFSVENLPKEDPELDNR